MNEPPAVDDHHPHFFLVFLSFLLELNKRSGKLKSHPQFNTRSLKKTKNGQSENLKDKEKVAFV